MEVVPKIQQFPNIGCWKLLSFRNETIFGSPRTDGIRPPCVHDPALKALGGSRCLFHTGPSGLLGRQGAGDYNVHPFLLTYSSRKSTGVPWHPIFLRLILSRDVWFFVRIRSAAFTYYCSRIYQVWLLEQFFFIFFLPMNKSH